MFCPGETLLLVKSPVGYHFHERPAFIKDRMDFFYKFYKKLYDAVLEWFVAKMTAKKLKILEEAWLKKCFTEFSGEHKSRIQRNVSVTNFSV